MCLILFAYNMHPKYPLILGSNRDEFYHRPTAQAHYWEDHPHILAGRDLSKMGTWMGVTTEGVWLLSRIIVIRMKMYMPRAQEEIWLLIFKGNVHT